MFPLRNEGLFFWDLLGRILKKQDWFDVNIFKLDYWTCQFLLGFSFNVLIPCAAQFCRMRINSLVENESFS